jgi:hypothetical protein
MTYALSSPLRRLDTLGFAGNDSSRVDSRKSTYGFATVDAAATVEAANYFNAATELVRGDVIFASMNNGVGATPVAKIYVVTTAIKNGDAANAIALLTTTAG